jgi:hypothetical protein
MPISRPKIVPPSEITVVHEPGTFNLSQMPDIDSISPVKVDLVSVDHYVFKQNFDNRNVFQTPI